LLREADALAFITTFKAGAVVSGHFGTGLIISKLADGTWSAPCAISTIGMGIGAQLGMDLTDVVLVMKTNDAIEAFKGNHGVAVGGSFGVTVGPFGRRGLWEFCIGGYYRDL